MSPLSLGLAHWLAAPRSRFRISCASSWWCSRRLFILQLRVGRSALGGRRGVAGHLAGVGSNCGLFEEVGGKLIDCWIESPILRRANVPMQNFSHSSMVALVHHSLRLGGSSRIRVLYMGLRSPISWLFLSGRAIVEGCNQDAKIIKCIVQRHLKPIARPDDRGVVVAEVVYLVIGCILVSEDVPREHSLRCT